MEEPTIAEEVNEVPLLPIPSSSIPTQMLDTMPITIRDVLKCKKPYKPIDVRTLLVPLIDVPQAYIASPVTTSNNYAGRLHFQAKVDKLYLTKGVTLQEYRHSHSRMNSTTVNLEVKMITSATLLGKPKKRSPNKDLRWKELANMFAMRSKVLKNDIATMYREYLVKQKAAMPRKPPIGKSMFYTKANNITGGGKQQEGTGRGGLHKGQFPH